MVRDAEAFATKLGALEGSGDAVERVLEAARSKVITPPGNTPPPPPQVNGN